MITKTYLDNRLNQLEEQLRRRIEMKDERISQDIETDLASLKNSIKLLEGKIEENRDMIKSCFEKQNGAKQKTEEVKPSEKKEDVITSDL